MPFNEGDRLSLISIVTRSELTACCTLRTIRLITWIWPIGDFKYKAIAEYCSNLDLLYTPEAFLSDFCRVLNQVLPELNKVCPGLTGYANVFRRECWHFSGWSLSGYGFWPSQDQAVRRVTQGTGYGQVYQYGSNVVAGYIARQN